MSAPCNHLGRLRARAALFLLLLLTCGGCTRAGSPRPDVTASPAPRVATLIIPIEVRAMPLDTAVGWARFNPNTKLPTGIDLDVILATDVEWARFVSAHEIGHVLGCEHGGNPGDWMFYASHPRMKPPDAPTPDELRVARKGSEGRTFSLMVAQGVAPEIVDALAWACARWNEAMGRTVVFVVNP